MSNEDRALIEHLRVAKAMQTQVIEQLYALDGIEKRAVPAMQNEHHNKLRLELSDARDTAQTHNEALQHVIDALGKLLEHGKKE